MLEFNTALAQVLTDVPLLGTERVPCADARGRVLREPLVALERIPRFDTSAVDGYAVLADPCRAGMLLPVVGEMRAGQPAPDLVADTAMRIFTGAALPRGADAVVMQECVRRDANGVVLNAVPAPGENVRHAGEDLRAGEQALASGGRISAGTLMLAAALDQTHLTVAQRPRVAILCTGDELRAVGSPGPVAAIPESNSPGLRVLAQQAGAQVVTLPPVPDVPELLTRAIAEALAQSDLLVTIGGVSVGEHDYVKAALESQGAAFDFWKVAIKPGKPLAFARRGACRILALPGNPASALVTFGLFAMPLLRALQGDAMPVASRFSVVCGEPLRRNRERLVLCLGRLLERNQQPIFMPHRNQSSGATTALAQSSGIAFVAAGTDHCDAGASIAFMPWSQL